MNADPAPPVVERSEVIQLIATALFYDLESVRTLADYFVSKHMDLRCKGSEIMDDLVRAIMHAQFDMTLVSFYGLPTPTSAAMAQVTILTLFAGHTLAIPTEFVAERQLIGLYEGFSHLIDPRARFYNQARYGHTRGEIVLESFNGKRELAARAWPPLLLTMCYRAYVRMLHMAVASGLIDAPFARALVSSSTATLRAFIQPNADVPTGRLESLTCISRDTLVQQLTRLHATMVGSIDLLVLQKQLEELAIHFAGYCSPPKKVGKQSAAVATTLPGV